MPIQDTDVLVNIYKRRESIVYKNNVPLKNASIAYLDVPQVNSTNNLSISDTSLSLVENRVTKGALSVVSNNNTFISSSDRILITDIFYSENGQFFSIPLFNKHIISTSNLLRISPSDLNLDTSNKLVSIEITDSNFNIIKKQISLDLDKGIIYSNLDTVFNSNKDYSYFYIKYIIEKNNESYVYYELLNNEPVYTVASFEDLNDSVQLINDGRKVYLIEDGPLGFLITLPSFSTYVWKTDASSRISITPPSLKSSEDPWYVSISNGSFSSIINGSYKKYYIAEYLDQGFDPTPPFKKVSYEDALVVEGNIIKLDNPYLALSSFEDLYLNLLISNEAGIAITAFSNNPLLESVISENGKPFLKWNTNSPVGIKSIDYKNSLIETSGIELKSTDIVTATYYYKEEGFTFTNVNLNPLNNPVVLDQTLILFIDPDNLSNSKTKTIYYLILDDCGKVLSSDWPTISSLIGFSPALYYRLPPEGVTSSGSFINNYTTEGDGDLFVLGEVTVSGNTNKERSVFIDSRKAGGELISGTPPRVPYFFESTYLVEVPMNILKDINGKLTQKEVKDIIGKHTAAGVYPIAKTYGANVEIQKIDSTQTTITLDWSLNGY